MEPGVVPKSFDGSTKGTVFEEWGEVSLEAGDAFGKTLRIVDESADYMRKAGFQDVTEQRFPMPIGRWPKDKKFKHLGQWNRLQWEESIESWTMYLLTIILKVSYHSPVGFDSPSAVAARRSPGVPC